MSHSPATKAMITAALGAALASLPAHAAEHTEQEKCYGVAKAGKNDCSSYSGSHSCAGQSQADNDKGEWLFTPKGLCEKLAGGTTDPKPENE